MKKLFTYILEWPTWVIGAVILAQIVSVLLTLGLTGYHLWNQYRQPVPVASWTLDSTTYYKNLYQQGKLNYDLYLSQKGHSEQLARLDKKRKGSHRRIDSLAGPALQHELDSLYNGGGQPTGTGASGPKTNAANGSGGASGAKGPGRSDHAQRGGSSQGHLVADSTAGDYPAGSDDSAVKPVAAAKPERGPNRPEPGQRLPAEVARSATGKLELARSGSSSPVRTRQGKLNLTYWRLIRKQGFTYPEVAWAISAAETGYWWSPTQLVQHGHNLFGMKKNTRAFYVSVSAGGYCLYDNQLASLDDYGSYEAEMIRKYGLTTQTKYVDHICRRFCPNPTYRGKLDLAFQALRKVKPLA